MTCTHTHTQCTRGVIPSNEYFARRLTKQSSDVRECFFFFKPFPSSIPMIFPVIQSHYCWLNHNLVAKVPGISHILLIHIRFPVQFSHNDGELSPFFMVMICYNQLFLWPLSIAMFNSQRVNLPRSADFRQPKARSPSGLRPPARSAPGRGARGARAARSTEALPAGGLPWGGKPKKWM